MSIVFTGQVAQIFPVESFTGRDGHLYNRRRVLLQTIEQYPQRMVITLSNDTATNFAKQVGETVTAHLSFDVHPNREQTAFFNDIRAWRID